MIKNHKMQNHPNPVELKTYVFFETSINPDKLDLIYCAFHSDLEYAKTNRMPTSYPATKL